MVPEPTSFSDGEKLKHLETEIKDMINILTNRLANLQHVHKSGGGSSHHSDEHGGQGMRIVTLAGNNVGATMRGDMDEKGGLEGVPPLGEKTIDGLNYFVNSNFQAVNNSIMMGSKYSTNDPGVHMELIQQDDDIELVTPKYEVKDVNMKKKRGRSKSEKHTDNSE